MDFPDPRPWRLLVIRYRFIGDTVLAIPFLRNLRAAFPQATIDVLAEPVSGDTLAHCPHVNTVLAYAPRGRGPARPDVPTGLWSCARMLRARRYDRVYILRRSFSSAILPLLAGIPHRVGFATEGRRWLLQRSTPYADHHEVECFLDVLRADGLPVRDTYNENWSDPAVDARIAARLRELGPQPFRRQVFICAKSVYAPKDWPPARFAAVIAWLVTARNCAIHFCDAPGNAGFYAAMIAGLPEPVRQHCQDWSRELPLRDVNSLFRHMHLAVGIDTGLLHIAASFHVPVVALFGPLEPARWHPWDTAHTIVRPADVSGPQPLLRISVAEVQAALDPYLSALPRSS
jgi:heptosyltransferase-2